MILSCPRPEVVSFVVREDTAADADVLLITIMPLLESAAIAWEARLRVVVAPMPDSATMVMDGVVIKPEPLMVPALRWVPAVPLVLMELVKTKALVLVLVPRILAVKD